MENERLQGGRLEKNDRTNRYEVERYLNRRGCDRVIRVEKERIT